MDKLQLQLFHSYRSFLGMAEQFKEPTVRICSWCPDSKAFTDYCIEINFPATHGQCPECFERTTGRKMVCIATN